jgi:hypothetical protein
MSIATAQIIVSAFAAYCTVGLIFAFVFLARAVTRLDPGVASAPLAMRVLILPGVVALWPFVASRWMRGFPAVLERTPHRMKANTAGLDRSQRRDLGAVR